MASVPADIEQLTARAIDWAAASGLLVRRPDMEGFEHAPFALHPRWLPLERVQQAYDAGQDFGRLVLAASYDVEWLFTVLAGAAEGDPDFTGRLLSLARAVHARGCRGATTFCLIRSDYMIDHPSAPGAPTRLLQVEVNTIASSFAALSARVSALHRDLAASVPCRDSRLCGRYGDDGPATAASADVGAGEGATLSRGLPTNGALHGLARGLLAAQRQCGDDSAVIVFVVQGAERNVMDQRLLELETIAEAAREGRRVTVLRRTLHDIASEAVFATDASVATDAGTRIADGSVSVDAIVGRHMYLPLVVGDAGSRMVRVGVAYMRAGYDPADYSDALAWPAREAMEFSSVVVCPNVFLHLVGAKKVQQAMAGPGVVERLLASPVGSAGGSAEEAAAAAARVRACFAGLWSLDPSEADDATREAIAQARADPSRFVIKPQREGGGHNLFGDAVTAALDSMSPDALRAYILMERIHPRAQESIMVRGGHPIVAETICEFGVYGVLLAEEREDGAVGVLSNAPVGHLVRTKTVGTDEGGVAAGYAVIDSPLLE